MADGSNLPVPATHGRLCLNRRDCESLILGEGPDAIVVTIDKIGKAKCRVTVVAPKNVKVLRGELFGTTPKSGD